MIRLRGHHLVCLHFYKGEGYRPEFVAYLGSILKRAVKGEQIEVVCGPDDVCAKCLFLRADKCLYNDNADEEIREMDETAVQLQKTRKGERVHWQDLRENLPRIFGIWSKKYCKGCDWRKACEKDEQFRDMPETDLP